jgi:hypothetical protein
MIDTLKRLIKRLEQMPEDEQEEIARRIEPIIEDVDERKWDELLATPESDAYVAQLIDQAHADERAGRLIDLDAAFESHEDE